MRLTLRTLLAYLDQILDEPDAEELDRKIQESELATQLVHRIRTVLGQRRLAALDVRAAGLGRDANSVAEYLDNTLAVDEIPDFERVCLESDVHLSEVAACHQILTLVLGEPAAVPEGLKEKIYGLPRHPAIRAAAEATPSPPVPETTSAPAERRPTPDEEVLKTLLGAGSELDAPRIDNGVSAESATDTEAGASWDEDEHWTEAPDYLKRPRPGRWKPVAIVTLIAFCLAMAALRGMGTLDRNHPLAKRFGLFDSPASSPESNTDTISQTPAEPVTPPGARDARGRGADEALSASETQLRDAAGDSPATEPTEPDFPPEAPASVEDVSPADNRDEAPFELAAPANGDTGPMLPSPLAVPPAEPEDVPPDSEPPSSAETFSPEPSDLAHSSDEASPFDSALPPDTASIDDESDTDVGFVAEEVTPVTPDASDSLEPTEVTPELVNPLATARSERRPPPAPVPPVPGPRREAVEDEPTIDDGLENVAAPVAPTPRAVDIGRFLDTQQVLVKWDPASELWHRVDVGARLQVGDVLMSLPTYRSPLVLTSGMQVNLIGGTRVEVLEPDAEATPFFRLAFGRLTVATFAQAGITFGLSWAPDHSGVLSLADANTTLAIELKPGYPPGSDPETTPAHQVLHIYVSSGSADWSSDQGPAIKIAAGQRLTLIDAYPALLKDWPQQPEWIDGRDARPRDPIAARDLAQRLTPDRPVTLVLKEEADSRRFEVRSLAVCSLAYLGDFDPLFVALNDAKLRVYWPAQYEVLERVPSYSPEFMTNCKMAILQRHGEEEGMKLYRMLWGYSPEQLADGSATELFDYLDHPSYDFRIVASEQLKSITGQPSLYRANAGERDPQRRAAISRWRKLLDNGEIVYQRPPELIELLNELAPRD